MARFNLTINENNGKREQHEGLSAEDLMALINRLKAENRFQLASATDETGKTFLDNGRWAA